MAATKIKLTKRCHFKQVFLITLSCVTLTRVAGAEADTEGHVVAAQPVRAGQRWGCAVHNATHDFNSFCFFI